MKIDKTVLRETKYIAIFTVILSVLMQSVFLIVNKWDYTVLLGNVWGALVAVANFFVMGLFVQKAVTQEEKEAKKTVKASQSLRLAAMLLLTAIGAIIPIFNIITVVIPLLFPSIAIFLKPFVDKNK